MNNLKNKEIKHLKNGVMHTWDAPENEFGIKRIGLLIPNGAINYCESKDMYDAERIKSISFDEAGLWDFKNNK